MLKILTYELQESKHLSVDRAERIQVIADRIGFGSELYSYDGCNSEGTPRTFILTDTGVMIVKAIDCDVAVTAFLPTMTQAKTFFLQAGVKMPKWFAKVIVRNGAWRV